MAQLSVLSGNAQRLLDQLNNDLARLESGNAPASLQGQNPQVEPMYRTLTNRTGEISAALGNVGRLATEVEGLARREIAMAKREKALLSVLLRRGSHSRPVADRKGRNSAASRKSRIECLNARVAWRHGRRTSRKSRGNMKIDKETSCSALMELEWVKKVFEGRSSRSC